MIKGLKRFLSTAAPMTLFEKVWLIAPVAVWFSYHPLIRFGSNTSMYFELSVTTVYVAILALAALPIAWRNRKNLVDNRGVLLVTAFIVLSGLSLLWTSNRTRGLLTFGLLGALYVILLASISRAQQLKKLMPALTKILIAWAIIIGILSLVQIIASLWFDRSTTLLCPGCTPQQFGFARPNGFTIEPQFLGNVLLIPSLVLFHVVQSKKRTRVAMLSLFAVLTTLFLTLSRGAIFAFGVGLLVLLLIEVKRIKGFALPGLVMFASFVACLLIQGLVAAANPKLDASFPHAIRTSINQLSLGVIKLPVDTQPAKTEPVTSNTVGPTAATPNPEAKPVFNGYVEESTNVRLNLSSYALKSWNDTPQRILFGVGLGGSGTTLHEEFPTHVNQREIVQNEFIEVLLENGLIGLLLFVGIVALLLFIVRKEKWLWAIIAAFLVQWNFFSGYPNALHIYLVFIMLAATYAKYANKRVREYA